MLRVTDRGRGHRRHDHCLLPGEVWRAERRSRARRDRSHASGFAYGGLSPLGGFGIPGPLAEIAQDGMQLHRELSKSLLEETGIDVDFRVRSSLALAFTQADVRGS